MVVIMYEPEDDYMEEGDESEEISNEIWQEACWTVISAYFEEKGKLMNLFVRKLLIVIVFVQVWSDSSLTRLMSLSR